MTGLRVTLGRWLVEDADRRVEIGVRLAVGATPADVTCLIVTQGGRVIAIGIGLGSGAAFLSSQMLRSMLFGVAANDLVTHAGAGAVLLAVAMIACWWPARRAARLAPTESLRMQ